MSRSGLRFVLTVVALAGGIAIAHPAQDARPAATRVPGSVHAATAARSTGAPVRQVTRTQLCTVHKELRLGDYVLRHETCRPGQAVAAP